MITSGPSCRPNRSRTGMLGSTLLLLAGVPLVVFHAGLLFERAMNRETLDSLVAIRWTLSLLFLALLRGRVLRLQALDARTLGIVLLLVLTLIHAPVGVPEPAIPMAAAGLGLALTLVLLDPAGGSEASGARAGFMGLLVLVAAPRAGTRRNLKGRAPPTSR